MDIELAFALHRILNGRRHPVPTAELMTELECSRSTLHRAISNLRDSLGAPVLNAPGRGYFYDRDAGKFELPGLWFRADELEAVLVMDRLLESVQPGVLQVRIGPLRYKIKGLLDRGVRGRVSRGRAGTGGRDSAARARVGRSSDLLRWSRSFGGDLNGRLVGIRPTNGLDVSVSGTAG